MQRLSLGLLFIKRGCCPIMQQSIPSFLSPYTSYVCKSHVHSSNFGICNLTRNKTFALFDYPVRSSTVFTSVNSTGLWLGVTGPRGSTKKRARGKRRVTRTKIDLHFGQKIGKGKLALNFPGLTEPLYSPGGGVRNIEKGVVDKEYFQKLDELRSKSAVKKKRKKLSPLSRGWTGSRLGGQSLGPPFPEFPDFDTRILESKSVAIMNSTVGRFRRFSVFVVTGNGRGLCGIGKASAVNIQVACRRAKQRASQNIVSFDIKEDRTLWHAGYVSEWGSKIFAKPISEGSGLICHRVIRTICQVIGIKDMYAKVEGSTKNYQVVSRGFLRLLSEQETYETMANRIGLHVVEFTPDRGMFPCVLASPACGHTIHMNEQKGSQPTELADQNCEKLSLLAISHPERHRPFKPKPDEHHNFVDDLVDIGERKAPEADLTELLSSGERNIDSLSLKGRIPLIRGLSLPGYLKNPGNMKRASERYKYRNHETVKREREVFATLHRD